jgi:hypothetical protein
MAALAETCETAREPAAVASASNRLKRRRLRRARPLPTKIRENILNISHPSFFELVKK